jgi:hypothetical protein
MKQLTKDQAVAFATSEAYKTMNHKQIAEFQINQKCLCMPFRIFHEAVEKVLNRPVFTHEFGSLGIDGIRAEIMQGAKPPSFEDIIKLLPKEKTLVGVID